MLTRLMDIFISLIGGMFLLLMFPVIALLIKLDSRGPVFFKCDRVGKDGKLFKMYKFRTMYETPVPLGATVSPQGDPRVTSVGRLLRRLKLNEFPQFINILKGEMALIGPRPEAPDLAAAYPPEAQPIFTVKPGLVGPNQIIGRNEEESYPPGVDPKKYYIEEILPQKLPLDLKYIQGKSFLQDLKYLFLGIWVTITKTFRRQHLTDNRSQIFMLLADMAGCLFSFTLAHIIRFDGFPPYEVNHVFYKLLPLTVLTRIPLFYYFGCYQTLFRYISFQDLKRVFQGVALGSVGLVFIAYLSGLSFAGYGRSVFIIDWLFLTLLLTGYRAFGKVMHQHYKKEKVDLSSRRTLIWGTGDEGRWCLRYLQECSNPHYEVIGFIDEDPQMRHRQIDNHRVLGDSHQLELIAQLYKIQEMFIAGPAIPPRKMELVQNLCNQLSISLSCFVPRTVKEISVAPRPAMGHLQEKSPNRAIILAGGKGIRLSPLTEVIPKPLVPVGGMPILEIVIRQLKAQGFQQITLAVGYLSELIKAYFQVGSRWGVQIDYSYEPEPLGTVGPLALIDGLQDTFLVMNADVLTNLDYNALMRYHRAHGGIATIGSFERQVKIDLGVIIKDGDGCIKDYVEKPTTRHLVSMGIYVFEPQVLDFIPGNGYLDFPDLVKILLKKGLPVHYYPFSGYWLDIGRHEDHAKAVQEFETLQKELVLGDRL